MGTGDETDAAEDYDSYTDEYEGEVDPDVLEVAVAIVQEMMNADRELALAVAAMMEANGHQTLAAWAAEWPRLAVSLAEDSDDLLGDGAFVKAMEAHGKAQRDLAEKDGYTRDVWHRPPGAPVE